MNDNYIAIRKPERDCFCRGCDTKIKKKEDVAIYTYSMRNKGQNIFFCMYCAEVIGMLYKDNFTSGFDEEKRMYSNYE